MHEKTNMSYYCPLFNVKQKFTVYVQCVKSLANIQPS